MLRRTMTRMSRRSRARWPRTVSSGDRISVTFARRPWLLRRASAHDWMMALARDPERLAGVFPGLIRMGDVEAMCTAMEVVSNVENRWQNTARKALEYASGRDWWRAYNLM